MASLLERRAALATSEVEPGELAGASLVVAGALSGAQTEEGAAKLLPEVEVSTLREASSGTTVGVGVGILNLVSLIFWITLEKNFRYSSVACFSTLRISSSLAVETLSTATGLKFSRTLNEFSKTLRMLIIIGLDLLRTVSSQMSLPMNETFLI
ncbi:hypothetical protein LY90DRAFT_513532 [Neocallimastix californiae]|uniref:Uncharacterized protein n=1 Tax=Neocallimastix californiae TaxID=1754190 RepID=A0A1Y2AXC8_9FUNG|nr:hypothetical protein LY90DRAFT_513532 [Neocallimastix californiae]|eukprot:ORY27146.1 hypothetical protein LY90DRAFT_513532 [Neocallimastix californiae]